MLDALSARYLAPADAAPPTEAIAAYVAALLARYPDLPGPDEETEIEVPWGSGPLINNASGPIVCIDMKTNSVVKEGWRYCVEVASSSGLVAFDPQSGELADPDPISPSTPGMPDVRNKPQGRAARAYRWASLRSYRWPALRPLAVLLRRYR